MSPPPLTHISHPLVTHMQRFSLHDGPGIRTTVFFKGCPLRCPWCCNPEGIRPGVELACQKHLCLGMEACGLCAKACPRGCFQPVSAGAPPAFNRQSCDLCMACVDACPPGALARVGEELSPSRIIEYCRQDMDAYALSGGGLTLSGGEPLARPDLAAEVLREAQNASMQCALETCGWFDMDNRRTREALACLDLCIIDLKHDDSTLHQRHTGVDTARIHTNLRRLAREFPRLPLHVRITIVPGFNDHEGVVLGLARLASSIPTVAEMELVPFHTFGESKYGHLGRPFLWEHMPQRPPAEIQHWQDIIRRLLPEKTAVEAPHAASR